MLCFQVLQTMASSSSRRYLLSFANMHFSNKSPSFLVISNVCNSMINVGRLGGFFGLLIIINFVTILEVFSFKILLYFNI